MKKSLFVLALLAGCGGGSLEVNCMVANSCSSVVTVSGDPLISPPGTPSVDPPPPVVNEPPTAPPASSLVPLAQPQTVFPLKAFPGHFIFKTPSETFVIAVVEATIASWVGLYRADSALENATLVASETLLNDILDLQPPLSASDADIRAWMTAQILPKLNTWLAANSFRLTTIEFSPVSTLVPPDTMAVVPRLAARLPQFLQIKMVNGLPVASLK